MHMYSRSFSTYLRFTAVLSTTAVVLSKAVLKLTIQAGRFTYTALRYRTRGHAFAGCIARSQWSVRQWQWPMHMQNMRSAVSPSPLHPRLSADRKCSVVPDAGRFTAHGRACILATRGGEWSRNDGAEACVAHFELWAHGLQPSRLLSGAAAT